ncbi:hypothetical protein PAAG_11145 [Paracoccidioides lutzii Pb01]|uniref:Uncharacterized protein n=1 Tax=Paracoccidioides lutzii (strain ATCC MYA-826 / Pb01) TaxID=502779 RepID=A0A0A2V3A0_PARBA|nr:hypothetical protein PAAG_11145 [Paracoccidioides lutzii Pb01]KGQ01973.1 hypothetical protein PAAG_11145 [Paracoccidioides lutzii Pb01]
MTRTITPPPYPYVPKIKTDNDHGRRKLPTVTFTKGSPEPVCTGNCGSKCKGPFCREPCEHDCGDDGRDFFSESDRTRPKNMRDYDVRRAELHSAAGRFHRLLSANRVGAWVRTAIRLRADVSAHNVLALAAMDPTCENGSCKGHRCTPLTCEGKNCASGFCTGPECETGKDGYSGAQTARRCTELVTKIQLSTASRDRTRTACSTVTGCSVELTTITTTTTMTSTSIKFATMMEFQLIRRSTIVAWASTLYTRCTAGMPLGFILSQPRRKEKCRGKLQVLQGRGLTS